MLLNSLRTQVTFNTEIKGQIERYQAKLNLCRSV